MKSLKELNKIVASFNSLQNMAKEQLTNIKKDLPTKEREMLDRSFAEMTEAARTGNIAKLKEIYTRGANS